MAKSVGVVCCSRKPDTNELVAHLQVRGSWNHEKDKPETWPGGCQVTAHGKLKPDETFEQGRDREVREELGRRFGDALAPHDFIEVMRAGEGDDAVVTYATLVDHALMGTVELHRDSPKLREIQLHEVQGIQDLRSFDKGTGVTDLRTIAMFDDEKWAVRAALERFGS